MENGFETQFVITDPVAVVRAIAMWLEQAGLALNSANGDLMDVVVPQLDAKSSVNATTMMVWSTNAILVDKLNLMAALLSDAEPLLTAKGAAA